MAFNLKEGRERANGNHTARLAIEHLKLIGRLFLSVRFKEFGLNEPVNYELSLIDKDQ